VPNGISKGILMGSLVETGFEDDCWFNRKRFEFGNSIFAYAAYSDLSPQLRITRSLLTLKYITFFLQLKTG